MVLQEITPFEYGALVDGLETPIYNKSSFLELNRNKVDAVHYLLGRDTRNRIAFAIGEKNGEWAAPFSAPFSSVIELRKNTTVEIFNTFFDHLVEYVKVHDGKSIDLYPPANIYGEHMNAKVMNALLGNGFAVEYADINYSFELDNINLNTYESMLHCNARKNLRIAMKSGLGFVRCSDETEVAIAYEIIAENRAEKGYPLWLSQEQLLQTLKIVNHDCFLVKADGCNIAAAIVYRVTDKIAQVIYWGDLPGSMNYKPVNYLAYNLICYYKNLKFRILDIGISTEKGNPNYGLCVFRESIGCVANAKPRFRREI